EGLATVGLDGPGLWNVRFRFRDTPATFVPLRPTPLFEAAGVVAITPALAGFPVPVFTARRREPGALTVQLQDAAGRPAQGYVVARLGYSGPAFAGATDDRGTVRFDGLPDSTYELTAYLAGPEPLDVNPEVTPPANDPLRGQTAFGHPRVAVADDTA